MPDPQDGIAPVDHASHVPAVLGQHDVLVAEIVVAERDAPHVARRRPHEELVDPVPQGHRVRSATAAHAVAVSTNHCAAEAWIHLSDEAASTTGAVCRRVRKVAIVAAKATRSVGRIWSAFGPSPR